MIKDRQHYWSSNFCGPSIHIAGRIKNFDYIWTWKNWNIDARHSLFCPPRYIFQGDTHNLRYVSAWNSATTRSIACCYPTDPLTATPLATTPTTRFTNTQTSRKVFFCHEIIILAVAPRPIPLGRHMYPTGCIFSNASVPQRSREGVEGGARVGEVKPACCGYSSCSRCCHRYCSWSSRPTTS